MADIKEIHGIVAARAEFATDYEQQVRVVDQEDGVHLLLSSKDHAARMTPAEARRLAEMLNEAADRVEE